ncbi:MAG: cell envelope integrity protein TolA, partial [Candidatus Caldatribacteriota bacterium]|nr:cell envelope integrity protein TolA [Candidatus Caldatribacteriota bacterium]
DLDIPYNKLDWGMQTKEGALFKKALDKKYAEKPAPKPEVKREVKPEEKLDKQVKKDINKFFKAEETYPKRITKEDTKDFAKFIKEEEKKFLKAEEEYPKKIVKEEVKELKPLATPEQKQTIQKLAEKHKLIYKTKAGNISDNRYKRLAKAMTGKTSSKAMTKEEASEFIKAIEGIVQRRPWEPPIIPVSNIIVPKEFFENLPFKEPKLGKYVTPKEYLLRQIGAEDLLKDIIEAKKISHIKGQDINQWIDKTVKEINKKAPIGQKIRKKIFRRPTDRIGKFRDLLDNYKTAPDFLSPEDKKIFTEIRDFTKGMLDNVNKVRERLDLDPIKEIKEYIPHFLDELAKQIVKKKYPFPEDVKYWLGKNMPKKISNPTEMERRVNKELTDLFSKDLGKLLKMMSKYDLRDIYFSEPYAILRAQLNALGDKIPASVRKEIDDFLKYDIFDYPDELDELFNRTVEGPVQAINYLLKPFGRVITNPAKDISSLTRRLVMAGAIAGRLKLPIRNIGQRMLVMNLYQPKYFLKAQLLPTPKELREKIKDTTFWKLSAKKGFEDIPQGQLSAEQLAMKPYGISHAGVDYLSNVDVAMKAGAYFAQDMIKLSKDKNSAFYKYAVKYAEKHDIPLDKLLWTDEDVMIEAKEAGELSQWLYFKTGMPRVYRGQLKRAAFTLQSWSLNYLFKHVPECVTRTFTGRTSRGKLLRPIDRINWLKGTAIIMGTLWGLKKGFDLSYEKYLLPWGIALNTNFISPVGQMIGGAFNYVTARNKWERTKAKWQVKGAYKVFIPGSLAYQDLDNWLSGEKSLKETLFYMEWKKEKKTTVSEDIDFDFTEDIEFSEGTDDFEFSEDFEF